MMDPARKRKLSPKLEPSASGSATKQIRTGEDASNAIVIGEGEQSQGSRPFEDALRRLPVSALMNHSVGGMAKGQDVNRSPNGEDATGQATSNVDTVGGDAQAAREPAPLRDSSAEKNRDAKDSRRYRNIRPAGGDTVDGIPNGTAKGKSTGTSTGTCNDTSNSTSRVPSGGMNSGTSQGASHGTSNDTSNGTSNDTSNGASNGASNGTLNGTSNGISNNNDGRHSVQQLNRLYQRVAMICTMSREQGQEPTIFVQPGALRADVFIVIELSRVEDALQHCKARTNDTNVVLSIAKSMKLTQSLIKLPPTRWRVDGVAPTFAIPQILFKLRLRVWYLEWEVPCNIFEGPMYFSDAESAALHAAQLGTFGATHGLQTIEAKPPGLVFDRCIASRFLRCEHSTEPYPRAPGSHAE